ncbi:flagellar filament capping protein FliD [Paraburkholderia bonniea]|uniref:flagellar filament capping protein FliD n=1 Tax=Paraburkholderia bonniea TaxID=2152891 RepID=UPI0012925E1E|nr:flagellar filament capping protein FliD [Paraburkholderia bonniea]WJF90777.1 flagellar filament capping protein FliD [Paraburkholderia bonniea]WJF94091.1 flagellar filament capping protein FliD [Paraburkholderia bonniea]
MSIDVNRPVENATAAANLYMERAMQRLKQQKAGNVAAKAGLTSLQGALQKFQTALTGLAKDPVKHAGSLSNTAMGSVTLGANAQPGSYGFFVERLASAHQVSFNGIKPFTAAGAGSLSINLAHGGSFDIDLAAAHADGKGEVTPAELARAINQASGNEGQVNASVVTIGTTQQLVLSAGKTGSENGITLDTSGVTDAALVSALSGGKELSVAQDAVFYLGDKASGTRIEQASNTFAGIDGVSVTFTQEMRSTDPLVMLNVKLDQGGTAANVQSFVDAYNALFAELGTLTASGGADSLAGPLAADAGVLALQQRLTALLRGQVDGVRLFDYGVSADRAGVLSVSTSKLDAALGKHPQGLASLFGGKSGGLNESMDAYLKTWLSPTDGHLKKREESMQVIEKSLSKQETMLNNKYDQVYKRYLTQFAKVETLELKMKQTLELFENLPTFGGTK